MKPSILYFILAVLIINAQAQSKSKVNLKAFSREVMGGARLIGAPMEGTGQTNETGRNNIQYFVYLQVATGVKPLPVAAYIDGKKFRTTLVRVKQLPVLLPNSNIGNGRTDTLIAATNQWVWQIEVKIDKATEKSMDQQVMKLARYNELVLPTVIQSKKQYLALPKIKKLEALALQ